MGNYAVCPCPGGADFGRAREPASDEELRRVRAQCQRLQRENERLSGGRRVPGFGPDSPRRRPSRTISAPAWASRIDSSDEDGPPRRRPMRALRRTEKALPHWREDALDEVVSWMMAEYDKDIDNVLSVDEYFELWRKVQSQVPSMYVRGLEDLRPQFAEEYPHGMTKHELRQLVKAAPVGCFDHVVPVYLQQCTPQSKALRRTATRPKSLEG